jgi:hypothetical protein
VKKMDQTSGKNVLTMPVDKRKRDGQPNKMLWHVQNVRLPRLGIEITEIEKLSKP